MLVSEQWQSNVRFGSGGAIPLWSAQCPLFSKAVIRRRSSQCPLCAKSGHFTAMNFFDPKYIRRFKFRTTQLPN
jgi:hypothetical protein